MDNVIVAAGLGLFNSSLSSSNSLGQANLSSLVNARTGNLLLNQADTSLVGLGVDAGLVRTYNSQGTLEDDNGDNWQFGISRVKNIASGSSITRVSATGTETVYQYNSSNGRYESTDGGGAHDYLTYSGGVVRWFADGDTGLREEYNSSGQLLRQKDRDGNLTNFTYNSAGNIATITNSGQTLRFNYSGNKVTSVRTETFSGNTNASAMNSTVARYEYDSYGRLSKTIIDLSPENNSISDGKTYSTSYSYDGTSKRISSITQSDGTSVNFTYQLHSGLYKVKTVNYGNGESYTYNYGLSNSNGTYTQVVNGIGQNSLYFHNSKGQLTRMESPAVSGQRLVTKYTYDASGNLSSVVDPENKTTSYQYDSRGNLTLERDAIGNTVTRTYNSNNQLLTETAYLVADPDGAGSAQASDPVTVRYVRDSEGHVVFVINGEGEVRHNVYSPNGTLGKEYAYTGNTYNISSLSSTQLPTLAQMNSWLNGVDKSKSLLTQYLYDFRGQVSSTRSYTAVTSGGAGSGTSSITHYIYDYMGRLLETVSPRGTATSTANDYRTVLTYDGMGRVLTTTDAENNVSSVQYLDGQSKVVSTSANGLYSTSVYDAAGRLISTSQSNSSSVSDTLGSEHYYYDNAGRIRATKGADDAVSFVFYDEAGRISATVDGSGSVVELIYNKRGQVTKTIAYANEVNTAGWLNTSTGVVSQSSISSIRPSTHADDRTSYNNYNAAGQLISSQDGEGSTTTYQYDGVGRLIKTDTEGRFSRVFYDKAGRTIATLDARGALVENVYDQAGQLIRTTAYANFTNSSLRASGSLTQLRPATSTSEDQLSRFYYNDKGQLIGQLNAEQYFTEFSYDRDGNRVSQRAFFVRSGGTITDSTSFSSVRPSNHANDRVTSFQYDELGRISQETNHEGTTTNYAYDDVGNLIKSDVSSRRSYSAYDEKGQLTHTVNGVGSSQLGSSASEAQIKAKASTHGTRFIYDTSGRVVKSINAVGAESLYFYNNDGNAAITIDAEGGAVVNEYNAFGEVESTRVYVNAISTSGLVGGAITSTLLSRLSAAKDDAKDTYTEFKFNARGQLEKSLRRIINDSGNIAWYSSSNSYDQYGEVASTTTDIGDGTQVNNMVINIDAGTQVSTMRDVGGATIININRYDAFGRLILSWDGNSQLTETSYDRLGRVIEISGPLQSGSIKSYDAFNRVVTSDNALGQETQYHYSDSEKRFTVETPDGRITSTYYNEFGEVRQIIDANGNEVNSFYDQNGNLIEFENQNNHSQINEYDQAGRLITSWDNRGVKTEFSYDKLGRVLSQVVDPDGLAITSSSSYDAKGQVLTTTDARGVVTQTNYDTLGQVTEIIRDLGGLNLLTRFEYNGLGNQTRVIDAAGSNSEKVTEYVFDKLGRRISETLDPDGLSLTTRYEYDNNSNVVKSIDPKGTVTAFEYDANNRQTKIIQDFGGLNITSRTVYDAQGQITSSFDAKGVESRYQYNADGLLVKEIRDFGGLNVITQHEYDNNANRIRTIAANGTKIKYIYNSLNQVAQTVRDEGGLNVNTYSYYDENSNVVRIKDAKGNFTHYVYDNANRLSFSIDANNYVTQNIYDDAGQVLEVRRYHDAVAAQASWSLAQIEAAVSVDSAANIAEGFNNLSNSAFNYSAIGSSQGTITHSNQALVFQNKNGTTEARYAVNRSSGNNLAENVKTSFEITTANILNPTDFKAILTNASGSFYYGLEITSSFTDIIDPIDPDPIDPIDPDPIDPDPTDPIGPGDPLDPKKILQSPDGGGIQTIPTQERVEIDKLGMSWVSSEGVSIFKQLFLVEGKTYTVEFETTDSGVIGYFYEKGTDRNLAVTNYIDVADSATVGDVHFEASTKVSPLTPNSLTYGTVTLDNYSEQQTPSSYSQTNYAYDALGRNTYSADANGYITKNTYDRLGQMVQSEQFKDSLNTDSLRTEHDFEVALAFTRSRDFETGFGDFLEQSHLNPGSLKAENGKVEFARVVRTEGTTTQNTSVSLYRNYETYEVGKGYKVDLSTTGLDNQYQIVRLNNPGGSDHKYLSMYLRNGNLYAIDYQNGSSTTTQLGSIKANTDYTIEYQLHGDTTMVYMYEKGTNPEDGFSYQMSSAAWGTVRFQAYTLAGPAQSGNSSVFLDNYTEFKVHERPLPSVTTEYVYDAAGRLAFSKDAIGNLTQYEYDAGGNLIAKTLHNDFEDGDLNIANSFSKNYNATDKFEAWQVYDTTPAGATINTVYDQARGDFVTELKGTGTGNGYRLWNETVNAKFSQHKITDISWEMNYSESFVVYISVQTTQGHRYIYYTPTNGSPSIGGSYIQHRVGTETIDGTWRTFNRDLEADLKALEPDNELLGVNAFLVRGSGRIGEVKLHEDAENTLERYQALVASSAVDTRDQITTKYMYDALGRNIYMQDGEGYITENRYDVMNQLVETKRYAQPITNSYSSTEPGLIEWQDANAYISVDGNTIKATANGWNSYARSTESIRGQGYLEFTSDQLGKLRMVGLNHTNTTSSYTDLDYAFYLHSNNNVYFYEEGSNKGTASIQHKLGNEYRIEINAGVAKYYIKEEGTQEFVLVRTSTRAVDPNKDYFADVSLYHTDTVVTNISLSPLALTGQDFQSTQYVYDSLGRNTYVQDGEGYITENRYDVMSQLVETKRYAQAVTDSYSNTEPSAVNWQDANGNLAVTNNSLTATVAGWNSYARSSEAIRGQGFVEFQMPKLNHNAMVGLNHTNTTASYTDLDYAFYIYSDNTIRIYEEGSHKKVVSIPQKVGNEYRIEIDEGVAKYYVKEEGTHEFTLVHTSTRAVDPNKDYFVDVSLYRVGAEVTNVTLSPWAVTGQESQSTRYTYDKLGRIASTVDADNKTESYTYDANGNRTSLTNKRGHVWNYEYDKNNQLIKEKSPSATHYYRTSSTNNVPTATTLRLEKTFTYDYMGNTLSITDAANTDWARTTKYEYDEGGRQSKVIHPRIGFAQSETQTWYDAFGNAVVNKDVGGHYSYKTYNANQQVEFEVDALGFVTRHEFDSYGNEVKVTRYHNAINISSRNEQDFSSEEVLSALSMDSSKDRVIRMEYDYNNRQTRVLQSSATFYKGATVDGSSYTATPEVRYEYDAYGNVTKQSVKVDNSRWADTYSYYDANNRKVGSLNSERYLTASSYDAYGNMTQTTEYARQVSASINPNSMPFAPTNGDAIMGHNRVTSYEFDALNRQVSMTKSTGQSSSAVFSRNTYDAVGNVVSSTDVQGNTSTNTIDALGRTTLVTASPRVVANSYVNAFNSSGTTTVSPTINYYMDVHGNVLREFHDSKQSTSVANDRNLYNFYDVQGRLTKAVDANGGAISYKYDEFGRVTESSQAISYSSSISYNYTKKTRFTFDAVGQQIETSTDGKVNGSNRTITQKAYFNAFGEQVRASIKDNTSSEYTLATYNYNKNGQMISSNERGVTKTTDYNVQGQVTRQVVGTGGLAQATVNQYDTLGNLLRQQTPKFTGVEADQGGPGPDKRPVVEQSFDAWGNVIEVKEQKEDSSGQNTATTYLRYNFDNKITYKQEPSVTYYGIGEGSGSFTPISKFEYNDAGQLTKITDAKNNHQYKYYDDAGNLVQEKDTLNASTYHAYNAFGEKIATKNAIGIITTEHYDKLGRVTHAGIIRGSSENYLKYFSYDQAGNRARVTRYFGGSYGSSTEYTQYDQNGQVLKTRNGAGLEVHYKYDMLGNKTFESDGNTRNSSTGFKSKTWNYDIATGRLMGHTDMKNRVYSYTYNSISQMTQERITFGGGELQTKVYDYYANGLVAKITQTAPDGAVAAAYYNDPDIIDYSINYTEASTFEYDIAGNRTSEFHSTSRQATLSVEDIYYDDYGDAQGGTVTTENHSFYISREVNFSYDALNRLVQVTSPQRNQTKNGSTKKTTGIEYLNYSYDKNGNRSKVQTQYKRRATTSSAYVTHYYTYDKMNRMTLSQGTGSSVGISAGKGTILTYNALGQRTSATTLDAYNAYYGYRTVNHNGSYQSREVRGDKYTQEAYYYNDLGQLKQISKRTNWKDLEYKVTTTTGGGGEEPFDPGIESAPQLLRIPDEGDGGGGGGTTYSTWYYYTPRDINGSYKTISLKTYDDQGRLVTNIENHDTGARKSHSTTQYYADDRIKRQYQYERFGSTDKLQVTTLYDVAGSYDLAGNLTKYEVKVNKDNSTTYHYTNTYTKEYEGFGAYKESRANVSSTLSTYKPGYVKSKYDALGNLMRVTGRGDDEGNFDREFVYSREGSILFRLEGHNGQDYYHHKGNQIASAGEILDADFDYNYQAVTSSYPASTPNSYTVSKTDTLRSIAQSVYGDSSLWFHIADANSIQSDNELEAGMRLTIPNVVGNIHNDSTTFKPFDFAETIGDTTPTLNYSPPPPPSKGCGIIAMILVVIVAVVATVLTAGAMAAPAGAGLSGMFAAGTAALTGATVAGASISTLGLIGIAAVAGAVGSVAGQLTGMALGVQDKFSWKDVAIGGLTAAATAGVGAAIGEAGKAGGKIADFAAKGFWQNAAVTSSKAVVSHVANYGANQLMGNKSKFDWAGLATSAITAPIAGAAGKFAGGKAGSMIKNRVVSGAVSNFTNRLVSGTISGVAQQVFAKNGKYEFVQVAADAFGNTIADSITSEIARPFELEQKAKEEAARAALERPKVETVSTIQPKGIVELGSGLDPIADEIINVQLSTTAQGGESWTEASLRVFGSPYQFTRFDQFSNDELLLKGQNLTYNSDTSSHVDLHDKLSREFVSKMGNIALDKIAAFDNASLVNSDLSLNDSNVGALSNLYARAGKGDEFNLRYYYDQVGDSSDYTRGATLYLGSEKIFQGTNSFSAFVDDGGDYDFSGQVDYFGTTFDYSSEGTAGYTSFGDMYGSQAYYRHNLRGTNPWQSAEPGAWGFTKNPFENNPNKFKFETKASSSVDWFKGGDGRVHKWSIPGVEAEWGGFTVKPELGIQYGYDYGVSSSLSFKSKKWDFSNIVSAQGGFGVGANINYVSGYQEGVLGSLTTNVSSFAQADVNGKMKLGTKGLDAELGVDFMAAALQGTAKYETPKISILGLFDIKLSVDATGYAGAAGFSGDAIARVNSKGAKFKLKLGAAALFGAKLGIGIDITAPERPNFKSKPETLEQLLTKKKDALNIALPPRIKEFRPITPKQTLPKMQWFFDSQKGMYQKPIHDYPVIRQGR